jgi:hypothetical protein
MTALVVPSGGQPAYQNPAFAGGDITYTNVNGGANFPTGAKVVICAAQASSNFTGCKVGGNSTPSQVAEMNDGTSSLIMYYYDCGAGVGDTVVLVGAAGGGAIGANIVYLTGAAAGAPASNANYTTTGGSDDCVVPLTVPAGSFGVAAAAVINAGGIGNPPTWVTGSTRDATSNLNSSPFQEISVGHITATGNAGVVGGNPYFFGNGRAIGAVWASGAVTPTFILADRVLDLGLNVLDTEATHLHVLSAGTLAAYADVTSLTLGNKNFGAGNAFGSPAADSTTGRKVTSVAITDGTITTTGTVAQWAAVDATNSRLLAQGPLTGGKAVTAGQTFTLGAIPIQIKR